MPFRPKTYAEAQENAERARQRRILREQRATRAPQPVEPKRGPTLRRKPSASAERPKSPRPKMPSRCFCGCNAKAVHLHHAIRVSVIERNGGDTNDARVLLGVGFTCHLNSHWSAFRRYRLDQLPDSVFEFAAELLGAGARAELRRHYDGDDPRMEMLP